MEVCLGAGLAVGPGVSLVVGTLEMSRGGGLASQRLPKHFPRASQGTFKHA